MEGRHRKGCARVLWWKYREKVGLDLDQARLYRAVGASPARQPRLHSHG